MLAIAAARDDLQIAGQPQLTLEIDADLGAEPSANRSPQVSTRTGTHSGTRYSVENRLRSDCSDPLSGKITEIVLHSDLVSLQPMILPMLSQLSRGDRWLALVAPPSELTRNHLLQAATDLSKTLTLRCETDNAVVLAAKALCAGTCHTVILWHPQLTREELKRLENAALAGGSHCLAIHGHSL